VLHKCCTNKPVAYKNELRYFAQRYQFKTVEMSLSPLLKATVAYNPRTKSLLFNGFDNLLDYRNYCNANAFAVLKNPEMWATNTDLVNQMDNILNSFDYKINNDDSQIIFEHPNVAVSIFDSELFKPSKEIQNEKTPEFNLFEVVKKNEDYSYENVDPSIKIQISPYLAIQREYLLKVRTELKEYEYHESFKIRLKNEVNTVAFGLIMRSFLENLAVLNNKKQIAKKIKQTFMDNDGKPLEGNIYRYLFDKDPYNSLPSFEKAVNFFNDCKRSAEKLRKKFLEN
jgi:hypothetical protein